MTLSRTEMGALRSLISSAESDANYEGSATLDGVTIYVKPEPKWTPPTPVGASGTGIVEGLPGAPVEVPAEPVDDSGKVQGL